MTTVSTRTVVVVGGGVANVLGFSPWRARAIARFHRLLSDDLPAWRPPKKLIMRRAEPTASLVVEQNLYDGLRMQRYLWMRFVCSLPKMCELFLHADELTDDDDDETGDVQKFHHHRIDNRVR